MMGKGERGRGGKGEGGHVCLSRALLLLSLSSFLPLAPSLHAQTRMVELVNADSVAVESDSLAGTVRRLVGNVVFRQDTTALSAARAVQYVERGEVVLDGGVRIVSGRDTLTADRVTYMAASKIANAVGRVRIADGVSVLYAPQAAYASRERLAAFDAGGRLLHEGTVLTAPRGTYDTRARFATAEGGARLEDSTVVVTSERATYDARRRLAAFEGDLRLVDSSAVLTSTRGTSDTRERRADFTGDAGGPPVRLARRNVRLEADSLTHFRRTGVSDARGRVVLERLGDDLAEADGGAAPDSAPDFSRRTLLFGAHALHDDPAGRSEVWGRAGDASGPADPLLVRLRTDSTGATDTTLVRARRLVALRPPEAGSSEAGLSEADSGAPPATRLTAWGEVRLAQSRFAAVGDSAVFLRSDSTAPVRDDLALYGAGTRPSVWFDRAQVTGDTLTAGARGERLDTLRVVGNAFAAQLDTTLGRVRQIRGRRMLALFDGSEANRLRRLSVWPNAEAVYYRATPEGLLDGADRLSADSLAFLFAGDELREVRGVRGIEGVAYGAGIVPEGLALDGYAYAPDARPTRATLLPPDGREAAWLAADAAPDAPPPDAPPPGGQVPDGQAPAVLPPTLPASGRAP